MSRFKIAYTDRLIREAAKAAAALSSPKREIVLRDFPLDDGSDSPPRGFEAWSPHAVLAYASTEREPIFDRLKAHGRPLVHNCSIKPTHGEAVVIADSDHGYHLMHDHFSELGRSRVAAVFIDDTETTADAILRYRAFCQRRGVAAEIIHCPEGVSGNIAERDSPLDMSGPLACWLGSIDRPVGLMTPFNYVAAHACRACHALGLQVPRDVAIIGTDDFDVSFWVDPPQTSIDIDAQTIAEHSIRLALDMLDGTPAPAERVRLRAARLIVRGSTAAKQKRGLDLPGALKFIEQHAVEGVSMQDVVESTQGVSRQTFAKHFKASTGMSPQQAIRKRKIDEARHMLRSTDVSITALARICGFCDDTQFRRLFSDAMGCSPSAYRNSQRG